MTIKRAPGIFAAVAGVSAVVLAGFGWVEILAGWGICCVLRGFRKNENDGEYGKAMSVMILVVGTLLLGIMVQAAEQAFPADETFPFVSAGLLLLLYKMLRGEDDTTAIVTNVLGLVLLGLLGFLTVFGLENVSWEENIPREFRWDRMLISFTLFSPWWIWKGERDGMWFGGSGLLAAGMSLMTRGILGSALTEYSSLPLYQAVQTIHVLGTLQRLEAILAAAVMLGVFSMLAAISSLMTRAGKTLWPEKKKSVWLIPILLISFLTEYAVMYLEKGVKDRMTTIFWGVMPIFALCIVIFKKDKKVLDKTDDIV